MKMVLDHIVLNVEDVGRAVDFYRSVLGLKIERLAEFEKGHAPFPSVRVNDETVIDLFPPGMWKNGDDESAVKDQNLSHFCLALGERDWKDLTDRLRQHNVKIKRFDDNNWGAKGVGVSIYFNDTDGNEIEARYYK
jgi:catechol 2,3-dioxygenase-like lactoylglutathione lyase family enzyme